LKKQTKNLGYFGKTCQCKQSPNGRKFSQSRHPEDTVGQGSAKQINPRQGTANHGKTKALSNIVIEGNLNKAMSEKKIVHCIKKNLGQSLYFPLNDIDKQCTLCAYIPT
jgi:hypothetical protein